MTMSQSPPRQPRPRRAVPRTARTTAEAYTRLEQDFRRRMAGLAEGLAQGRIELEQWVDATRTELRRYHLASSVLGVGGASQVDAEVYRIAERKTAEQYAYLDRWADEMRRGAFPLDAAPRVRQRAQLYAGAAHATFSESRAHRYGVPALPFQPSDGGTACLSNCKCRWEYKLLDGDGNWDIYYRLAPAEHCEDCLQRAAQANPLRVRDGVIVDEQPLPHAR